MATIKEIAALAGVSRGTVDRVLNGRVGVSIETAKRVCQVISQVGYVPNKAGKSLAVRKRGLNFGFLLLNSASSNPFLEELIAGAEKMNEDYADYGITILFRQTLIGQPQAQIRCIRELLEENICGLVIMPEDDPQVRAALRDLETRDIPVITVNTDIENSGRLAYVGSNYTQAGATAAGLAAMAVGGTARVGVIAGSPAILCHTARIEGFRQQAERRYPGLQIVDILYNHDDDFESYDKTKALLLAHPDLDLLYLTAAGVEGACRAVTELERNIPIICFDTVPTTAELLRRRVILAAIGQQPLYQGRKSLELLFEYVALGIKPRREFYYTENLIKIEENL